MRVKIVDGFRIRNTLDVEFSMIADRATFPYVPKGEIWIERCFLREKDAVLARFVRKRALARKHGYERAKAMLRPKGPLPDPRAFRVRRLGRKAGAAVWLVRGRRVREALDPNFCFGGHGSVYAYVPKGEIWIDDAVPPAERPFILVHEAYELALMRRGKGYSDAHDHANAAEKEARRAAGVGRYPKD